MGKKKDKGAKSNKRKDKAEHVKELSPDSSETVEAGSNEPDELVPGNDTYVEYVTTEDVMELVNSLDQNLDQLDKSTQALQQQIAQNQKSMQRQLLLFKIIALILIIGTITVGYTSARSGSRTTRNVDIVSAGMDEMRSQVKSMNASIAKINRDIDKLELKLNTLSANVIRIDQSVSKMAKEVSNINSNTNRPTYDPWHTGRPWR